MIGRAETFLPVPDQTTSRELPTPTLQAGNDAAFVWSLRTDLYPLTRYNLQLFPESRISKDWPLLRIEAAVLLRQYSFAFVPNSGFMAASGRNPGHFPRASATVLACVGVPAPIL